MNVFENINEKGHPIICKCDEAHVVNRETGSEKRGGRANVRMYVFLFFFGDSGRNLIQFIEIYFHLLEFNSLRSIRSARAERAYPHAEIKISRARERSRISRISNRPGDSILFAPIDII